MRRARISLSLLPNVRMALGLRTVDGSFNNLVAGPDGIRCGRQCLPADDRIPSVHVDDGRTAGDRPIRRPAASSSTPQPRTISNLIVDQTANNPAAYAAAFDPGPDGVLHTADDVLKEGVEIVTGTRADGTTVPDVLHPERGARRGPVGALQRLDDLLRPVLRPRPRPGHQGRQRHRLHPAAADDPLCSAPTAAGLPTTGPNFMVLTRATNQPGPDGILGTADDIHEHTNTTSPFVDQNQTYSSHPSHQVFLRAYELERRRRPGGHRQADRQSRPGRRWHLRHRRRRRDRRHGDLGRRQGAGARHPRHQPHRCRRQQRAAARDRRLRQLPARARTASRRW